MICSYHILSFHVSIFNISAWLIEEGNACGKDMVGFLDGSFFLENHCLLSASGKFWFKWKTWALRATSHLLTQS